MASVNFAHDDEETVPLNSLEVEQLRSLLQKNMEKLHKLEQNRSSIDGKIPNTLSKEENDNGAKKDKKKKKNDDNDVTDSFSKKNYFLKDGLPPDTFSLLVFPLGKSTVCAILVFFIQMVMLSLLALDVIDLKANYNNPLGVPPNVEFGVRICQFLALIVSVLSQSDVIQSLHHTAIIVRKKKNGSNRNNGSREEEESIPISLWSRWILSMVLRLMEGLLSLVVTFMLVMRADNVRDLLLDFTAVSFVSSLDNVVYTLGLWGFWGSRIQKNTKHIMAQSTKSDRMSIQRSAMTLPTQSAARSTRKVEKELSKGTDDHENDPFTPSSSSDCNHDSVHDNNRPWLRIPVWLYTSGALLFLVWLPFFIGWIIIGRRQMTGVYLCRTLYVQFGDDFSPAMGTFSGLYDIERTFGFNRRVQYIERRPNNVYDRSAKLSYCANQRAWTLTYVEENIHDRDNNITIEEQDPCSFKAVSSESISFDILDTADSQWYSVAGAITVPLNHLRLQCYDCSNTLDDFCAPGQGTCVANRCVCNDGWYGLRCEFRQPCEALEVTTSAGFLSARDWSDQFNETLRFKNGQQVSVYNRPVYINKDFREFDLIVFTGWRWIMLYSALLFDRKENPDIFSPSNLTREDLANYFQNEFHANYAKYYVGFISEPVNVDTRLDTAAPTQVRWYSPEARQQFVSSDTWPSGLVAANLQSDVEAGLFCSICNNETNPCDNGGICHASGKCECVSGNTGTLCEVYPSGNGLCNPSFNIPGTQFDGGDCCLASCVSNGEHQCGRNETGHYVGFPNCIEPQHACPNSEENAIWIVVATDKITSNVSWELVNDQTGEVLLEGGPYKNVAVGEGTDNNRIVEETCMAATSCAVFTIQGSNEEEDDGFEARVEIYWDFQRVATVGDDSEDEGSFKFGQC